MCKVWLYTVIFCFCLHTANSQYRQDLFRVINKSDGLPSLLNHRVYETSDGYLWIASQTGLIRYDGKRFELFSAYFSDSNSITANIVTDLQEDASGQLWIGSFTKGLSVYNLKTGKWKQYRQPTIDANPVYAIMDIHRDKQNVIWVGTGGRGLLKFNPSQNTFTSFLPDELFSRDSVDRNNNTVREIADDPDDKNILWLACMTGLFRFDKSAGTFTRYENLKQGKKSWKDNSFHALLPLKNDMIWLGAWGGGVISFNRQDKTFYNYPIQLKAYADNNLSANIVFDLYPISDSSLYVATYDSGLVEFNLASKKYTPVITNETGISREEVRPILGICATSNNCLWVCGLNNIYLSHPAYNRFGKWQRLYRDSRSLFKYPTYLNSTLWMRETQSYWLAATSVEGVLVYDSNFHFMRSIPVEGWKNKETNFSDLSKDKNGNIWLRAGDAKWLYVYDQHKGTFVSSAVKFKEPVPSSVLSGFIIDDDDRIWFVKDSSLYSYNIKHQLIKRYPFFTDNESRLKFPVKYATLVNDHHGNIWIGTNIGLWKFDPTNNRMHHYYPGKKNSLFNLADANINCLAVDKTGKLWVAPASQGIQVFDVKADKLDRVFHISAGGGFRTPNVNYMQCDNNGKMWVCTPNGLGCWEPDNEQWKWYDKKDGLVKDYTDQPVNITENGKALLAQYNGFIAFTTDNLTRNDFQPRLRMTGLLINGNERGNFEKNENEIRLESHEKQINFLFAAVEPVNPGDLEFRYRLSGFDEKWYSTRQNNVLYGALPPGDYVFQLKAQNSDGLWSSEIQVPLTMLAPFWQRAWFIVSVLLIIALVFYGIYRYRIQQVYKIQELRNTISQNLHDELGSSVSSINMLSEVAVRQMKKEDPVIPLLQQIGQSAQQAGESIDEIIWSVNPVHDVAAQTFNRIRSHISQLLEKVGIDYTIDLPELPSTAKLNMELRQDIWLICKEAVNNMIKYAHCKNASVKVELNNQHIDLYISDDGKGFDVKQVMRGNRNGLRNMEARVKKYRKGLFNIDSSSSGGTQIFCRLPFEK